MFRLTNHGEFKLTLDFLKKAQQRRYLGILKKYAEQGIIALSENTPKDTGKTSKSWGYEIKQSSTNSIITFTNDNIVKGVPIAIILQYGHGTGTGGYVAGRDYINPALRPIFDKMAQAAWEEVTR